MRTTTTRDAFLSSRGLLCKPFSASEQRARARHSSHLSSSLCPWSEEASRAPEEAGADNEKANVVIVPVAFFFLLRPIAVVAHPLSLDLNLNLKLLSDKRRFLHGGLVPIDPMTPDVRQACSKRAFDGQVRKWRRMLHEWDPEGEGGEEENNGAATTTAAAGEGKASGAATATATTPGVGPLVSPGTKRNASFNAARTPASAVHPRKQRARGGAGGAGKEEEGDGKASAGTGTGIFADAVLVSAEEATAAAP